MTIEFIDYGISSLESKWEWGCIVTDLKDHYGVTIAAMNDWCEDQFGTEYLRIYNEFYFCNDDQRILFVLRWS